MWRIARQAYGLEDPAAVAPALAVPTAGASPAKKVKTPAVLDQFDETVFPQLTQQQWDRAYRNHVKITGADPPTDAEPTGKQIPAFLAWVVNRGEGPYADFSVLCRHKWMRVVGCSSKMAPSSFGHPGSPKFRNLGGVLEGTQIGPVHASLSSGSWWCSSVENGDSSMPRKVLRANSTVESQFPETWHLIGTSRISLHSRNVREIQKVGDENHSRKEILNGSGVCSKNTLDESLHPCCQRHCCLGRTCGETSSELSCKKWQVSACRLSKQVYSPRGSAGHPREEKCVSAAVSDSMGDGHFEAGQEEAKRKRREG